MVAVFPPHTIDWGEGGGIILSSSDTTGWGEGGGIFVRRGQPSGSVPLGCLAVFPPHTIAWGWSSPSFHSIPLTGERVVVSSCLLPIPLAGERVVVLGRAWWYFCEARATFGLRTLGLPSVLSTPYHCLGRGWCYRPDGNGLGDGIRLRVETFQARSQRGEARLARVARHLAGSFWHTPELVAHTAVHCLCRPSSTSSSSRN